MEQTFEIQNKYLKYLTDIPRQREEYEVIYGTRRNARVEYLFYHTPNSQS